MKIALDHDGVIGDLHKEWVKRYNKICGLEGNAAVSINDIKEWNIHKAMPIFTEEQVYGMLRFPGMFYASEPIPGVIDALESIAKDGHDVYIITHAIQPTAFNEKYHWVKENIDPLFPVGKEVSKRMFSVSSFLLKSEIADCFDIVVDDMPTNFKDAKKALRVVFDAPYNRDKKYNGTYDRRVTSWQDLKCLVAEQSEQERKR